MSLRMKGRTFALTNLADRSDRSEIRAKGEKLPGARLEVLNATSDAADVYIYGDIAWYDITAASFAALFSQITAKTINVHINSGGGDVFDGLAIFNLLAQKDATINVMIDGLAASIASVIAMAGDTIQIAKNASMMIHNAWTLAMGDKNDMRAMANLLEMTDNNIVDVYMSSREGLKQADVVSLMDAETWMTAQDAVDKGFADSIMDPSGAKALVRPGLYAKMPAELLGETSVDPEQVEKDKAAQLAVAEQTRASMQRRLTMASITL